MKQVKYLILAALGAMALTACNQDKMTDTIFPDVPLLDSSSYTFEFDKYLVDNYLMTYNISFLYKLGDETTDMEYNLVPVAYDKAQIVAHAVKYLWLEVYANKVSVDFLRQYTPRIINVLGSPAMNAAQQTETLGVAEGGVKITLYNMNDIDLKNIKWLNKYIFHVMHHEFSHILHQNKSFPKDYELISAGNYDSQAWQYNADTTAYRMGFVTPYSMSEAHEDFVEVISSYITDTREVWKDRGFNMAEDHTHLVSFDENKAGAPIINTKITYCKDWLMDKYSISLDSIRAEVQRRQDAMIKNPDIVMADK